jgi:uncharacterized protein (TIGR02246 family)
MDLQIIAECACRRLHARYADALWRKDPDSFAALFSEDAVWKVAGMQLRGRSEIRSAFAGFVANLDRSMMLFGDPVVEAGEGWATSRTLVTERNRFADGRTATTIGVYYERMAVEADGQWRFTWRHWDLHYIGPPDFSAEPYPVKDYGPPPAMPAPDDPTTVRRDFLFRAADGTLSAGPERG